MQKQSTIRDFLLDLLFPKFCFGCQKEGVYLCDDCAAGLEVSEYQYCLCQKPLRIIRGGKCQRCSFKKLNGLYFSVSYQNTLVQALIKNFKYKPFIKELAGPLAALVISHFQLLDRRPDFSGFILVPIPLTKKRFRQRGFNQAEELAKELAASLNIRLSTEVLIKIKESLAQAELTNKDREKNIKDVFACKNPVLVQKRKVLLADDVYTTGATMEEAAAVLKEAGASEVWGITVARG